MTKWRRGPRPVRECRHGGKHPHGNRTRYTSDGCRCDPCTDAALAYENNRNRLRAYGLLQPHRIPAAATRAHLLELQAAGIGYRHLSDLTGLSHTTIRHIATGRTKLVNHETERAILEVKAEAAYLIDGIGSRRRIQALIASGWSMQKLTDHVGLSTFSIAWLLDGHKVKRDTAERIRAAYDRLWDQMPPVASKYDEGSITRSRKLAAEKGWALPLAWDDETIDDPAAEPATVARRKGNRPTEEVIEDVDWLRRTGTEPQYAAARIGMTHDSLRQALKRHGRGDLLDWLAHRAA